MYIKYLLINETTLKMSIPALLNCEGNNTNISNYFSLFNLDENSLLSKSNMTISELTSEIFNTGITLTFTIPAVDYETKKQELEDSVFLNLTELPISREQFITYLNR